MAEALGKTHFPTMLSGVLRGRRKGDPNTSVVGKNMYGSVPLIPLPGPWPVNAGFDHPKMILERS